MSKKITLILAIFALYVGCIYADTATTDTANLTVQISNIRSTKGTIRVALFNSEKDYRKSGGDGRNAFKKINSKIGDDDTISVVFKDIPNGTYAIKLFQDEDGSGAIETDWLGRPKEDFGFSNNISAKSGEPDFDQVKFTFDQSHKKQKITMQKALVSR
jgi:uncharacterized protein (DUF2141 family)